MSLIPKELESVKAVSEQLNTTLKALQVAQEELRQQNEELAATRQAAEAERQRYQELFEFTADGYLVSDPEGVIQEANHAAATLLNVAQDFLVGKPLLVFFAEQECLPFYSELIQLRQVHGVKDWEVRLCRRDCQPIDAALSVAVVRNQEGKAVALRWLLRDITERKRMEAALYQVNEALNKEIAEHKRSEQALRESEERFRSVVDNALDIITVLSADGTVRYASPSLERVLGYKPAECVGKNPVQYIHPDDLISAIYTFINARQNPGIALPTELRFQHKDGSWRMLEAISKKFSDQVGVTSFVVNCRDITERKRTEEIRLALEKEKELSELKLRFFSLASHEFRTPLSTILMATQLLQHFNGECPKEKIFRNLQRIETAGKHMTHLLNDILTINRAETGKLDFHPQLFDLEKFCRNLVEEMQGSAGSQYTITFSSKCPGQTAYMDERLLGSIITNLLENAIKYSPQGGDVDFVIVIEQKKAIFRIRDEGIGIPQEDIGQMFEPFHRGKNVGRIAGTGLGLTVVKKCVELHGGTITVASKVGVGTTSTVTLPLNRGGAEGGRGRVGDWEQGKSP
jgi:PAS domain S-box-containing protein